MIWEFHHRYSKRIRINMLSPTKHLDHSLAFVRCISSVTPCLSNLVGLISPCLRSYLWNAISHWEAHIIDIASLESLWPKSLPWELSLRSCIFGSYEWYPVTIFITRSRPPLFSRPAFFYLRSSPSYHFPFFLYSTSSLSLSYISISNKNHFVLVIALTALPLVILLNTISIFAMSMAI